MFACSHVFFAARPRNTFWKAKEKVLEGLVTIDRFGSWAWKIAHPSHNRLECLCTQGLAHGRDVFYPSHISHISLPCLVSVSVLTSCNGCQKWRCCTFTFMGGICEGYVMDDGRDEILRSPLFKRVRSVLREGWRCFRNNMRLLVVRSLFLKNKRLVFMNSSLWLLVKQVLRDSQAGNTTGARAINLYPSL